jgi:hypothetical protein
MHVESSIEDIANRLRQGSFPNEQSISQGVVLRLLQALGWDTWDTGRVWPEFKTGEGRADFALCHPPKKPVVFVEVKQPGRAEDAVRQALAYAFHVGVQFVVLTDGRTWSFYLPAEQGSYEERRVYKLDLYERPAGEAAVILKRYLAFSSVQSGEVLETARKEYRNRNRQSLAKKAIQDAWLELAGKGDESLVDLLADEVESRIGIRPNSDDVAEYLLQLTGANAGETRTPAPKVSKTVEPQKGVIPPASERAGILTIKGKSFRYRNAKDAMVTILRQLAKADGGFLERFSQHPGNQGRKRRYVAKAHAELYPDRDDLWDKCEKLPGGWLVSTNLNNVLKMTIIKNAASVAGLHFGTDLIVEF